MPVNYRWDEFKNLDLSVAITNESITVPSSGDPYVRLAEIPRQDDPSSLFVYAAGDKVAVAASDDTYIYEGSPSVDYSGSAFIAAGRDDAGTFNSYICRGFLHFDVSAMPADAGRVLLWMHRQIGHSNPVFNVHRVLAPWTASTTNWGTQPEYYLVPEASVNVSQQPSWYSWDITALYNEWKLYQADPLTGTQNNGVALLTDEISTDTISNWSSLESSGSTLPHLDIMGTGTPLVEVGFNIPPATNEYAVSYPTGRLRFHPSKAGDIFIVDYMGTGSPVTVEDLA